MPLTFAVHAVTTIGMDMGKNTLHMIGLDTRGGIVLREKVPRGRITSSERPTPKSRRVLLLAQEQTPERMA